MVPESSLSLREEEQWGGKGGGRYFVRFIRMKISRKFVLVDIENKISSYL